MVSSEKNKPVLEAQLKSSRAEVDRWKEIVLGSLICWEKAVAACTPLEEALDKPVWDEDREAETDNWLATECEKRGLNPELFQSIFSIMTDEARYHQHDVRQQMRSQS